MFRKCRNDAPSCGGGKYSNRTRIAPLLCLHVRRGTLRPRRAIKYLKCVHIFPSVPTYIHTHPMDGHRRRMQIWRTCNLLPSSLRRHSLFTICVFFCASGFHKQFHMRIYFASMQANEYALRQTIKCGMKR